VCEVCGQLVASEREALLEDVHRRTGWPSVPFSDGATVRFALLDTEGLVTNVRLHHGLAGHHNPPSFVNEGDGLFTLEFEAGDAWRVEYMFELLGPNGFTTTVHDPLNPLLAEGPFGGKSVVLREGCVDTIWLADPHPDWVGEFHELPIALSGPGRIKGKRSSAIWQPPPPEHGPWRELPLLLFLDGTDYVRFGHMRRILENLVGCGRLAPCRAVFVAPLQRNEEYSANPAMPEWIERLMMKVGEVSPLPEREQRFAVGTSLGALCLLHAQSVNANLFGGLALQSGSYFQPDTDSVESKFPHFGRIVQATTHILGHGLGAPGTPTRIAATCGTAGENIRNNDRMMETLARSGANIVSYQRVRDAHNWTAWRNCIGEALMALLGRDRGGTARS
jgi:enterochelin esterase-like enzyme